MKKNKIKQWVIALAVTFATPFMITIANAEFGPSPIMFDLFDEDGDEKLSREELKTARETMKAKFIEKFDKNEDGKLSRDERHAARKIIKAKRVIRKAKTLESYDVDGDGELSEEEKTTAMDDKKTDLLEKYDTDKDGKLSKEEREIALSEIPNFGMRHKGFCRQ